MSYHISAEDIDRVVLKLNTGKAGGLDNILGEIIKATHKIILLALIKLFIC